MLAFILPALVYAVLFPRVEAKGLLEGSQATRDAGLAFCLSALIRVFSHQLRDPVLTDREYMKRPRQALRGFLLASLLGGRFIFLFTRIGLHGLSTARLPQEWPQAWS